MCSFSIMHFLITSHIIVFWSPALFWAFNPRSSKYCTVLLNSKSFSLKIELSFFHVLFLILVHILIKVNFSLIIILTPNSLSVRFSSIFCNVINVSLLLFTPYSASFIFSSIGLIFWYFIFNSVFAINSWSSRRFISVFSS